MFSMRKKVVTVTAGLAVMLGGAMTFAGSPDAGASAMAAQDWRQVATATDDMALQAKCAAGRAAGDWNECDIRRTPDGKFTLWVR